MKVSNVSMLLIYDILQLQGLSNRCVYIYLIGDKVSCYP